MKRVRHINGVIDATDAVLLRALSENGRAPIKELAAQVGLSPPSTAERVRRLEEAGVIEGYTIRVNPSVAGLPLAVLVRLRPMPGELSRVVKLIDETPEIAECDRVTGDDCFVAKAYVATISDLERLIDRFHPYASSNTAIIQTPPVTPRIPVLPVGEDE